jgi:hypothetical protein
MTTTWIATEGWTDTSADNEEDHYTFRPTIHTVYVDPDLTDEHVCRLLDQLQFLTANHDRHHQSVWYELGPAHSQEPSPGDAAPVPVRAEVGSIENCGTVGCLAGWTVLRTVEIPLVRDRTGSLHPGRQRYDGTWLVADTSDVAAEYLGLDTTNRNALFAADNSLGDLWRLAAVITGARIAVPAEFRDGPRQSDPFAAELLAYACGEAS